MAPGLTTPRDPTLIRISPLQKVAPGTDRAYGERHRFEPASKTEDVYVQSVASRCSIRPSCLGQILAVDDGAEAVQQSSHEPDLDGRQRDPAVPESKKAVMVEQWN